VAEAAIKRQGIATSERNEAVAVTSPHQNNFAMRLRTEVWAGEPPDGLDDWQEAFLTGLVAGERGLRPPVNAISEERSESRRLVVRFIA
jgi:hypothetical protein